MNLSYVRVSAVDKKTAAANLRKSATSMGFTVLGETELPAKSGTVFHVINPGWIGNLVSSDVNLVGLLPTMIVIKDSGSGIIIGVGSASVLGGVSQNPAIADLAHTAESALKELVEKSAGVGPLKPEGIKLYSTTTCPYCKMEAAWLDSNKVKYDEVHVDLNQEEARKMVDKTGQMGVPVTEIRYEGGQSEYIVGFNKPQLAQILNIRS